MRVLDGAIVVLDAAAGVQAQTETVWRQAAAHAVPALMLVNKMDKAGSDFEATLESATQRLGMHPVPIQLPLFDEVRPGLVRCGSWCTMQPSTQHPTRPPAPHICTPPGRQDGNFSGLVDLLTLQQVWWGDEEAGTRFARRVDGDGGLDPDSDVAARRARLMMLEVRPLLS